MLENRQLGHYRLLRRIGTGGMGEVYMAEDTRIARQVAIKVIRAELDPYPDPTAIQDSQKLFLREMRAITRLDHPHILQLFDFGEERLDGSILTYMVMPLRQEGSLSEWLQRRGGRLNFAETAHFLVQAAEALQHAHDHKIVHQDVKPANFLVRDRVGSALPDILLSDFGIAKALSATSTASQTVRGTPAYMAPEQWEGSPVPASDQYALGIMAYVLLTGQPPFSGRMEQVMRQHLMVQSPPPSTINPAIPPDVDKVILIALAKQPEARFGSIMAFARAFQQVIQPASGSPSSPGFIAPAVEVAPQKVSEPLPDPVRPSPIAPPPPESSPIAPTQYSNGPAPIAPPPPELSPIAPTQYPDGSVPPSFVSRNPQQFDHSASTGQSISPRQQTQTPKPGRAIAIIGVVVLLILSTVIGVGAYQVHVASVNATATADAQAQIDSANAQATVDAQSTADVQSTADAQATIDANNAQATAQTASDNPYPSYMSGNGNLVLLDPLSSPKTFSEQSNTSFGGTCAYQNSALHVSQVSARRFYQCVNSTQFGDFALEVQLEIISGDCGDVTIRGNTSNSQFYFFRICSDGSYAIKKYTDAANAQAVTPTFGNSSAISTGVNVNNTIGIVASGSSMTLYVNGQQVDSITDSDYSSGDITLCAEDQTNSTEVAFSNLKIWD